MSRKGALVSNPVWVKILAGLITLVVLAAVLADAGSVFLQNSRPNIATQLNPLNIDARVAALVEAVQSDADPAPNREELETQAKDIIKYMPNDPRGFVMLGQIQAAGGDLSGADFSFAHALEVSDTNLPALRWQLLRAIEGGETAVAARTLRLMTLRWPSTWDQSVTDVARIMQQPNGISILADTFQAESPQRRRFLEELRGSPETLGLAARVTLQLFQQEAPNLGPEIGRTLDLLMQAGQASAARNLLLFTLTPNEQATIGYVFNPSFEQFGDKGPFDWDLVPRSGIALARTPPPETNVTIDFLNAPTRLRTVSQTVLLETGTYEMAVEASGEGLALSSPIFVELVCATSIGVQLATVPLGDGTYSATTSATRFNIAADQCPVQLIQLTNRTNVLDWKLTNAGRLVLHSVTIKKVESN